MSTRSLARQRSGLLSACVALGLGACSSLPSSGPTVHDVMVPQKGHETTVDFKMVPLSAATVDELRKADTQLEASSRTMSVLAAEHRPDLVGPGDVLAISIYEVGVSLFASSGARGPSTGFDPSAHGETFPGLVVDASGKIYLPYLGPLTVQGETTDQIQAQIEQGLRGKSQDPKALVAVRDNLNNTVYVSGDVRKPGRMGLTLSREHLLDAVANAGGTTSTPEDTIVRLSRSSSFVEQRLRTIRSGGSDDIVLNPGDRIELIHRPRTYIVFGATSKVSEVPFETGAVSLAEAVARVGGPSEALADPSAVLLFRYVADPSAPNGESPVIYRLDMLNPGSYFLAQRVEMHDKDVVYIANAGANRPAKFVAIINQLFTPFVTARELAP